MRWLTVFFLLQSGVAAAAYDPEHKALTELLAKHVAQGVVNYQGLKGDAAILDRYLNENLRAVTQSEYAKWPKPEQMAYLINAYNAYTLKLVVDFYPVASIRDIGAKVGGGFFDKKSKQWKVSSYAIEGRTVELRAMGQKVSLDNIEHDYLRPKFKDARVHFALVCAALSCPYLRSEAYVASRLDSQLDDQGRQFMADPFRNRYDAATNTLYLSKIFDWFSEDFVRSGSVVEFVTKYLPAGLSLKAKPTIRYLEYDWSLNDKPGKS